MEVHFEIADGGNARDAGRLARGADDRVGHDLGGERADCADVGRGAGRAGGEREDDVAVARRVAGAIARAKPSCAICDTRVASVLVSARVGGDDAERGVLAGPPASPAPPARSSVRASAKRLAVRGAHAGDDLAGRRDR